MAASSLQILIEATDNASKVLRGISDTAQGISKSMAGIGAAMTVGVTAPIVGAMAIATKSAMSFESAMVDTNRAVGAVTASEMSQMTDSVMRLSSEMGIMPVAMAEMVAEAGKLGIARDQIEDYNRVVAQTGVAFDMSTDSAGESIAKLTNVLGYMDAQGRVNLDGLRQLNATIDYLGDSGATSQAAIVNVLGRAGGATRTFGLANTQAAAFATSLLNMGDAPEVVGTAISSMLPQLQNASRQSSKFQKGLAAVGIDARAFELAIKKDAGGALTSFIDALSKSKNASSVIQDMFGTGSDAAILAKLATNAEQFRKVMGTKPVDPGRLTSSFVTQQATAAANFEKLRVNLEQLSIVFGTELLPVVNKFVAALSPAIQDLTAFARANPAITKMAIGFGAVAAAVGPTLWVLGGIASNITKIANAAKLLSFVPKVFAGIQWAAVGLGAILAGVALAVFNIGARMSGLKLTMGETFAAAGAAAVEGFSRIREIPGAVGAVANLVVAKFRAMGSHVRLAIAQAMSAAVGAVRGITGAMQAAGAAIISALARGITSRISAVVGAMRQVTSAIARMIPGSPVRDPSAPLRVLNNGYSGSQIPLMLGQGISRGQGVLTSAMSSATGAAAGAIGSGAGGGGGTVNNFNFSPVINGGDRASLSAMLSEERVKFQRQMTEWQRNQSRVSYS